MNYFMRFVIVLSLSITLTYADKFSSQYCEFQLPSGWNCVLEGTEWVCQSTNADRKKEAIIILAAKVRGSQDSIPAYQGYLKKNKTFSLPGGRTQVSEPKYTKVTKIKSHQWVDSLHLASEVPGFYTRYMATVKGNLGIAVTFSVGQEHWASYKDVFENVIQTLKVFDNRANYKKGKFVAVKDGDKGSLLDGDTVFIDQEKVNFAQGKKGKAGSSSPLEENLLWILLLGGGAFAAIKLRKKKGGAKAKKKKKKKKD